MIGGPAARRPALCVWRYGDDSTPKISTYEQRVVIGSDDEPLGRVNAVLFHQTEPRVVGVEVRPPAAFGVIDRPPRYVLLDRLTEAGEALRIPVTKLPPDSEGEKALGFTWQESVVWHNMPVRSESGDSVGVVHDATFDSGTGAVTLLRISTGIVGDTALGRFEVSADVIRGFDQDAVVVMPGYADVRAGGGAAKAVAGGVAAVKVRGGQVADGALQVGVAAAGALGRSLKHRAGRKAIDKIKKLMDEDS